MTITPIRDWLHSNGVFACATALALAGVIVGCTGSLSDVSATAVAGSSDSRPTYPADQVPANVPTSGENLPFEVNPDASGEADWGAARANPTGGAGSVDIWFDGAAVQIRFSGNCGPSAYLSSQGNAQLTISGNVSGMWSTGSLCLPNSRTDSMTTPITSAGCWRDSSVTVTITGTPMHDGDYSVPITGFPRPCPGEWNTWDWSTNTFLAPVSAEPTPNAPAVEPPSTMAPMPSP